MAGYYLKDDRVVSEGEAVPVVWSGDVIVAGGGPGGLGSAIAANRNGLRTILIEQLGFLGGMCSFGCGMPLGGAHPAYISNGGIAQEILDMTQNVGEDSADIRVMGQFSYWYFHDSEYFKSMIAQFVLKEKLNVRLHTMVSQVVMLSGSRAAGVIVESKSGRQAMLAKTIVDCTGDADICALAGARYEKGRDADGAMMATTVVFNAGGVDTEKFFAYKQTDPTFEAALEKARQNGDFVHPDDKLVNICPGLRTGTLFCNTVRVRDIDGTNVEDLTKAELEARVRILQQMNFFRQYLPGCEKAFIAGAGSQLGVRDTRRIVGEEYLSTEDNLAQRKRDTGILRCAGPLDNSSRGSDSKHAALNTIDENDWFDIPYGALVPKGLDNIIVAGRSFSSSYLAQSGARGMGLLIGMGECAGTAAYFAVRDNVAFREVDVKDLQKKLMEQGNFLGNKL